MKKGKLFVIDGTDGSGKATQTKLLCARLKKNGYKVKTLDFPQYEENFMGRFIGECLSGKYGDFASIDPHIGSVLYAVDRYESKAKIEEWLKQGFVVVLDRYVSANQIHQGGKIADTKKRKIFLKWLDLLEYGVFGLPKPDAIFYLDVPLSISQKLLKARQKGEKRVYLRGKEEDKVESDEDYLSQSRQSALRLVKGQNTWVSIVCAKKDVLLPREVIGEHIWEKMHSFLKD